jgi:hypothetical protein
LKQQQLGATGHCDGTPHSCGSEPAQFNILPDTSGVPAETMRWICCNIKVRPQQLAFLQLVGAKKVHFLSKLF